MPNDNELYNGIFQQIQSTAASTHTTLQRYLEQAFLDNFDGYSRVNDRISISHPEELNRSARASIIDQENIAPIICEASENPHLHDVNKDILKQCILRELRRNEELIF